jgi:hypothetical protein
MATLSHSTQNGYHKENKQQMLVMTWGEGKKPLHTVDGNVN